MPDAKRDSALIFIRSKPVIYLVVSQARLSILRKFAYVSQTGPTVTTDVKEWEDFDRNDPKRAGWKSKSRPPDNVSLGCGIWQRLPSLLAFVVVLFPRY